MNASLLQMSHLPVGLFGGIYNPFYRKEMKLIGALIVQIYYNAAFLWNLYFGDLELGLFLIAEISEIVCAPRKKRVSEKLCRVDL